MSADLATASATGAPWHCSVAFYFALRPVHVRGSSPQRSSRSSSHEDTTASEDEAHDVFIIKLHQRLLPPSDVSQPLDSEFVDEQYAQQLASDEGLEYLRRNWFLLLALFFPCGGSPSKVDQSAGDSTTGESTRNLTEAEKEARNKATAPVTICEDEACHAGPLSPPENAVMRDPGTLDRIYFSLVVFLRFFGWRVHDEQRGVLDRHRGWQHRYALLAPGATRQTTPATATHGHDVFNGMEPIPPSPPSYDGSFNFYDSAISRMLPSLLSVGLVLFAVRLMDFLLEEMKASRLLALLPLVEERWVPLLAAHEAVEEGHIKRLKKTIFRLTHSDSD